MLRGPCTGEVLKAYNLLSNRGNGSGHTLHQATVGAAEAEQQLDQEVVSQLYDSHCHLPVSGATTGVHGRQLVCGVTEENWGHIEALQKQGIPGVRIGFGLHPWWLGDRTAGWDKRLSALLEKYPTAVVGEIGLDKMKGPSLKDQVAAMHIQLQIAKQYNRPVSVHSVRVAGLMDDIIGGKAIPVHDLPRVFIFHSYNGSADAAKLLLRKAGQRVRLFFGFSPGCLRSNKFLDVVKILPEDRLLLESDSMEPREAKQQLLLIAKEVAGALSMHVEDVVRLTANNAERALTIDLACDMMPRSS
ncbi:putative metal-dependent hydrolase YjjV [Diplonema papillatum]|nr:putative metal-dependent hydrolase YjjV [Diplonema papillatum]